MLPRIIVAVLFLTQGCANINQESQDHWNYKHIPKHGIKMVPAEEKAPPSGTEDSIDRGQKLYVQNCLECHGPKGEGDGPTAKRRNFIPQNLREQVANTPNFEFYINLSEWKGTMPGWKNQFTRQELKDLAAYIKTL